MLKNPVIPIIIVVAVVLFVVIARSIRNKKANYDERQLLARNTAYKSSFSFLLLYCIACGTLHLCNVNWAGIAVQMFLGAILSLALFIALCIIKDAYFSGSPKNNFYAVISFFSFGLFSIYYLLSGLGNGNTFLEKGELSPLVLYPVFAVCCFALGIISVIKIIQDKCGAEE